MKNPNKYKKSDSPLVSVIIPTYNRPVMLREALISLSRQFFKDFEVIIINDGGQDVKAVIDDFRNRLNLQYIHCSVNRDRSAARNKGLSVADGKYISYLDDDDIYYPVHLETLVTVLESSDLKIAYTDAYRAKQEMEGCDLKVVKRDVPHSFDFNDELILVYNFIPSLCIMHEKSCLDKTGYFDESLGTHEDWDLWIRLSRAYKFAHIKKVTAEYTWREDGTSTTSKHRHDFLLTMEKIYQKHKKYVEHKPHIKLAQTRYLQEWKNKINSEQRTFRCSIIIPVFNQIKFTKHCLETLFKNTPAALFETIIIDNNSTDGTKEYLKSLKEKVKVITNSENFGFAKACNQGAKASLGEYVLFLNNDTEVQSGWLEALIEVLDNDRKVAAIGSKLLFPDKTIQHAGVLIINDQKLGDPLVARHIYYQRSENDSKANRLRTYQALTAACLLVRKSAFVAVDGFDEAYWNGYEDIDLCFKFQQKGWLLVYQPKSVVIHYESQSGPERFRQVGHNIERLHQKWLNKVVPDRIVDASGIVTETGAGRIRPYIIPENQDLDRQDSEFPFPKRISIIILTHNQLEYTQKCIESVLKHTKEHFELIVVDNGSSDGTVEYFQPKFRELRPEIRTKIIQNTRNLGFAAGNNQAIAEAKGDYIILLNNDVVVTRGWLQRLLACAEQDPQTGIVGPRTNNIAGPQRVPEVSYDVTGLAGLEQFAAQFAQKNNRQRSAQWRIAGFCMLIKRKVIEKIGGLDTRYGLGNFEDDDFCIRAKLAGFNAQIAQDCFVHHFGSKTFSGARIDYQESLNKNWEIFKQKWDIPAHTPLGPTYRVVLPSEGFDPNTHYFPLLSNHLSKKPEDEKQRTFIERNDVADHQFSDLDFNILANPNVSKNMNQGGIGMENYEKMYQSIQPLLSSSNPEDAIAAVRNMVDLFPDFAQAHNDLGVLLYKQGEKERALAHYEQAVQLDGGNLTFKKNLADFYYVEQGRIEDALKLYVDVLALNPEDVETLLITGHICVGLQRLDDAEVFYKRVLEIEPWNADAQQLLEKIQHQGQTPTAAGQVPTAGQAPIDAKSPQEMYQEVQALMAGNDPQAVINALKDLLATHPNFALAHNDLGVLYYNAGDKQSAFTHYEQAARLEPDNITFKKNLGDFYFVEQNRVEDALKLYVEVLAIEPEDVETLLITGHICVSLQKFDDAKVFYNRVLEIEPWNTDARDNLATLESKREAI